MPPRSPATTAKRLQRKTKEGDTFRCGDCQHVFPINTTGSVATGYGITNDKQPKPICYNCCGYRDRIDIIKTGKATLYLTQTTVEPTEEQRQRGYTPTIKRTVTNWPGTLSFNVLHTSHGRHNIAGTRLTVTFLGPDLHYWQGILYGENTQLLHCKRLKQRAAITPQPCKQ